MLHLFLNQANTSLHRLNSILKRVCRQKAKQVLLDYGSYLLSWFFESDDLAFSLHFFLPARNNTAPTASRSERTPAAFIDVDSGQRTLPPSPRSIS